MAEADKAEPDLGPDELDRLEDALEELELEGALDRWSADELGPLVRARLIDYRSVLAVTREALPLEDVPAGLLDGVLSHAQQAAAVAPAAAAALVHESWWVRLRRSFMVPTLALAGTAALVLWVFDPNDKATLGEAPASAPAERPAPAAAARSEAPELQQAAPAATPTVAPADGSAKDADAFDKEASPSDDQVAEGEALEAKLDAAKKAESPAKPTDTTTDITAGADAGRGMSSSGDAPGAGQGGGAIPGQAKPKLGGAGPASGRWDIVSRGDRARQAGDCVGARDEYALALEDDEARVRARAFAGLGLCDAAAGDEASADANFERARGLDDAMGSFIESQSERSASKKSRKPAKKSKVQADAFDPFG